MANLGGGIVIDFAEGLFALEAYKRAAYALAARASVMIEPHDGRVHCRLVPAGEQDLVTLETDFRREVLDQDLRVSTERDTEGVRNLILGLAFSRVGGDG
jgi:His-Xaa-Ser system protein HxsD